MQIVPATVLLSVHFAGMLGIRGAAIAPHALQGIRLNVRRSALATCRTFAINEQRAELPFRALPGLRVRLGRLGP